MSAGVEPLTIEQGTDVAFVLTFLDSAGAEIDLTGYSFWAQIREFYGSPDIAESFAIEETDLRHGVITISLTAAQTDDLSASTNYVYDLLFLDTSVKYNRAMMGEITVSPRVSIP